MAEKLKRRKLGKRGFVSKAFPGECTYCERNSQYLARFGRSDCNSEAATRWACRACIRKLAECAGLELM